MEKQAYENLKDIRRRLETSKQTTFKERNVLNIYLKRIKKKNDRGTTKG